MKSKTGDHVSLIAGLLLAAACVMTSCGNNNQTANNSANSNQGGNDQMSDYIKTHQSGLKVLPWPLQMEALFGRGDHFITHYDFSPGPKTWNTNIFFGGRYEITLQVDVDIDYANHAVKGAVSEPKFYIAEVESLELHPNGSYSAFYSNNWVLNEGQWNKLVAAKGDWSVLGIPIKPSDPPIPGFDGYAKGWSAPKIPH